MRGDRDASVAPVEYAGRAVSAGYEAPVVGMVRMMYVGHENAMCLCVREQDVRAVHGRYGYLLRGVDAWLEREELCISLRAPLR